MSFGRLAGVSVLAAMLMWVMTPRVPPPGPALGAPAVQATVTLVGRPGSFGPPRAAVPSGQRLDRIGVPGWAFPAARKPSAAVIALDGTILMPAISHNDSLTVATSPEMSIAAYDPRTHTTETIRLASASATGPKGLPVAPTVTALLPLPGGAVAFTAWTEGLDAPVPSFGLLTKVDGHWQALPPNRFSGKSLGISRPLALARLPVSGELIVAQEGGTLTPLRITGPDLTGRYTVQARQAFTHPAGASMRHVSTDPTGGQGAEGFAVGMERAGSVPAVQEFSYDSRSGAITVRSAPLVPGDSNKISNKPYGYRVSLYDSAGNLWAARRDDVGLPGKLAVYSGPRCKPDGGEWARPCRPTYDIAQAAELPPARALMTDPATGTVVMLAEHGFLMPVRAKASGDGRLSFEIGNLVDIGRKLLTDGEDSTMDSQPGAVDSAGRLWFPTSRANHDAQGATTVHHWLLSVNLDELFAPPPTRLSDVPAEITTIQAENTTTTTTWLAKGEAAAWEVSSDAYFTECLDSLSTGCGYDPTKGNGFYLRGSLGFGFRSGSMTYRVNVPASGNYRLWYQVGTFEVSRNAKIELNVGGHKIVTAVATAGDWRPMRAAELVWLDAGVHALTIAPPKGGEGWFLNSISLQRV